MSRIKSFLFGLMVICQYTLSFGQQDAKPAKCTNPELGFQVGGDFTVSPEFGCLSFTDNTTSVSVTNPKPPPGVTNLSIAGYIFNFKDGDNIITFPTATQYTVTKPGTYWIMQGGNDGSGSAFIQCKSSEVIQPEQPEVDITTCGTNIVTVTFKKVSKNKQFGKYKISWGDGGPDEVSNQMTDADYPYSMQHTYLTPPTTKPLIFGVYTRGATNLKVCDSQPIDLPVGLGGKPRISELEGLNGGASNKITLSDGSNGTAYAIQKKTKGGNWVDTGKKITRNSGSASADQTIDGLDGNKEYCFRLQTKDVCNNETFSNEACTIIPKATFTSPTEAKIEWNNPDTDITATPNVTRYSVGYSEYPSGINTSSGTPNPVTETSFVYDLLDCNKKYNFNITAFLGTTASDKVVIKSPNILVEPTTGGKIQSNITGIVSNSAKDVISINLLNEDPAFKYIFYRAEGGSMTYDKVHETDNNNFDDKNVEPDKQQYCYKVEIQDKCGNKSDLSSPMCSVFLTSKQSNTLNWTEFTIPDPNNSFQNLQPVEYYVQLLDANGSVVKLLETTPNTKSNFKDVIDQTLIDPNAEGQVAFRVLARKKVTLTYAGAVIPWSFFVYSNIYTFITPAQIYVPTAFSPNNDSNNDTFVAKGRFIDEYNLVIYDRWGNTIFESKDLNIGWNGTTSDGVTPAPPGNYSYKIYGLNPAGEKFEKVGLINLIR